MMSNEDQKNIFLSVIRNLNDLNELLKINNCSVDAKNIALALDNNKFELDTIDMNIYLASLLLTVFKLEKRVIKLDKENINQVMILNFVNTVLERLHFKEIEYEMI